MNCFYFKNLNYENIRDFMLSELNRDKEKGTLYMSPRLNLKGIEKYPDVIQKSFKEGTDETFKNDMTGFFKEQEVKKGKLVKVPSNASTLLAQGEFNRFYIRAVCLLALSYNGDDAEIEIYRAKKSSRNRIESEMKIGKRISASTLLDGLRNSHKPTYLPEVNSGLSVQLPVD